MFFIPSMMYNIGNIKEFLRPLFKKSKKKKCFKKKFAIARKNSHF